MTDVIKEEVEAVAEVWDHGRGPKRIQAAWAGRGDSKQIRKDNQKIRNREEDKKMRADNAAMKKDEKKKMGEEVEQLVEGPSHLEYTGRVGKKEYAVRIPANKDLGDYNDSTLHNKITKANPHLAHHEVSAIVNSGGQDSREKVEHEGKTYEHEVVNHEEPRHVYSEEVEQVAEVLTKSMGAGKWIKDFVKSKNPKFAGKSEEKRKEMALGAFYSKEEVETVDEVTMRRTIPSKQERDAANKYYANHNIALSAEKRRAGIENYPGREDPIIGNLKGTFKKNSEKDKAANEEVEQIDELSPALLNRAASAAKGQANWAHGVASRVPSNPGYKKFADKRGDLVKKAATKLGKDTLEIRPDSFDTDRRGVGSKNPIVKPSHNEQLAPSGESLDEGRGRPPKPGSAAYKRRQSEGGGDSDTPGLHGQLIKHKSLQNAPPKIKFTNGEEAHISAEHRDRAIKHLEGMIGPGKNPQARDNAVKAMSKSHAGLKQAIGVESKPEETKSPMSAQRDKPKLSLTKEESDMSQEDIVEKLQAALDAGILSQNDFDKLTQIDELSSDLLNRAKEKAYDNIAAARTSTQFKKVQDLRRQGQKFKDAANAKTQSEEVEAVDEKALSPKQKKIAVVAGDPGKIDAEDFKKLRKEETTAGVAAVAAALSRNLKELK